MDAGSIEQLWIVVSSLVLGVANQLQARGKSNTAP
jgi:hypothetical protein